MPFPRRVAAHPFLFDYQITAGGVDAVDIRVYLELGSPEMSKVGRRSKW